MNPPRLHVICPDRELQHRDAEARLSSVLESGGGAIALHLRPRTTSVRTCLHLAQVLVPRAAASGSWIVVNGRVDVALVSGAHGVQLGRGALPVEATRLLIGPERAIGVSAHGPDRCREAFTAGADYVLLGTIFETPSHPGGPVGGIDRISECAGSGGPIIAIGGIDATSIPRVMEAGAHGVAVIRAVWQRARPERAVRDLRATLASATEER